MKLNVENKGIKLEKMMKQLNQSFKENKIDLGRLLMSYNYNPDILQ